jgi:hypothetical protein
MASVVVALLHCHFLCHFLIIDSFDEIISLRLIWETIIDNSTAPFTM